MRIKEAQKVRRADVRKNRGRKSEVRGRRTVKSEKLNTVIARQSFAEAISNYETGERKRVERSY